MANSQVYAPIDDPVTESNTTLLAKSQNPEVIAENRALCRRHGVKEGTQELRRLQHFVSQAIIRLLTRHNITQQNGRPYVSSSPKGFLQGPDVWLVDKGYYLSGWPRGLPKGSISIWPSYYTFALAAMFINGTISLKPLANASQTKYPEEPSSVRSGKPASSTSAQTRDARPKSEAGKKEKEDVDSDRDAEGSSESEQEASRPDVPALAVSSRRWTYESSELSRQRKSDSAPSVSSIVISPNRNPASPLMDSESVHSSETSSIHHPQTNQSLISSNPGLPDPRAIELLVSADLAMSHKRKIPEISYPGVPSDATIDWIPPTSAARESKRMKKP